MVSCGDLVGRTRWKNSARVPDFSRIVWCAHEIERCVGKALHVVGGTPAEEKFRLRVVEPRRVKRRFDFRERKAARLVEARIIEQSRDEACPTLPVAPVTRMRELGDMTRM